MSRDVIASNSILKDIYATGIVRDDNERGYPVHSQISPAYADALYRTVLQHKPKIVVEIGMAYGISSLAILSALRDAGEGGRLISVDPNQYTDWNGIGVANVRRSDMAEQHQLIELTDYLALPELIKSGTHINFAYVDGWHTFDYVLIDFFYLDKMLCRDGVIGFNDCGYRAIHRVLKFVTTHRKYQELDVGLKSDYRARNQLFQVVKWITGRSNTDRYFYKTDMWEPPWNFYEHF